MLKKLLVAATVSLGLLSPVVVSAPAEASYRAGCASHSEYNRLRLTQTGVRAHHLLGTTGHRRAWDRTGVDGRRLDVWRRYRPCGYVRDRIEVRFNDYTQPGTVDRGGALRIYKGTWRHYCLNSKPLYKDGEKIGYYCYDAGWKGRHIYDENELDGGQQSSGGRMSRTIVDKLG